METNSLIASINEGIAAGRTVYVATATRITPYSPRTVARIRAAGAEPFRVLADGCIAMLARWSKGAPKYDRITLSTGALLASVTIR